MAVQVCYIVDACSALRIPCTGDGWSLRIEDAVLHGCIPVLFHDGVHGPFESILEYDAFSIRLKESAVDEYLPKVRGCECVMIDAALTACTACLHCGCPAGWQLHDVHHVLGAVQGRDG